jgi:hypothetical protein
VYSAPLGCAKFTEVAPSNFLVVQAIDRLLVCFSLDASAQLFAQPCLTGWELQG